MCSLSSPGLDCPQIVPPSHGQTRTGARAGRVVVAAQPSPGWPVNKGNMKISTSAGTGQWTLDNIYNIPAYNIYYYYYTYTTL